LTREEYMEEALLEAGQSLLSSDVPVGCIIVRDGEIIARGHNSREADGDATAHAEIQAIREASTVLGCWNLSDCTLYVTLEPCPMCAGAILNARIGTLVFGAREPESGAVGSVFDLFSENYGYHPKVYAGVLAKKSRRLLEAFFRSLRK